MDYHDDFSSKGLEQETTGLKQSQHHNDKEAAENVMPGHFHQALLEENANNDWPMNGQMYDYQEHHTDRQAHHVEHDTADHAGNHDNNVSSCIEDYAKSENGQSVYVNDILNSNRQNMESSHLNKNKNPAYDAGNKFGRMLNLPLLLEDLRISKIIRRLMVENNRKASIDLCKKLEVAVRNQSNASYICRSFDILFDNMLTVLRQCPVECLENASSILGIMGYINRYNFAIYKGHLTKAYGNYKKIRKYLMMALKTTLRCDGVNLDLKTYSERLLSLLKEYLENAEVSENFISISETIAEFSKNYKTSFQRHFTDIVDIIVGWHLEVEQPTELKRHCAKILQQFAEYFLNELDFTFGLLGQFIEDIEACREDILSEDSTSSSLQQNEIRVGAFIGAFTSIVKALSSKGVNLKEFGTASVILVNAKEAVKNVAKICFEKIPLLSEETVVNLNEFYCIILLYDKSVENLNDFESIIMQQLKHLSSFNDNQQASFLFMVLNIVRQYRTQLPLSFITLIMDTENMMLQDLKLNCGLKTCKLLMKVYHEILIIKNVPLLQEAYRHILKDIYDTLSCLGTIEGTPDSMLRSEMLLNFYLSALTALACQTSSIIGMYALKPSILELLIKYCQAAKYSLWNKYPTLHKALLELIIDHCMKNHNFRQSSRLLKQHQDSPSSENFAMILKFLAELLKWHVSEDIFKWLQNILQECREDCEVLIQTEHFLAICDNITTLAVKHPTMCSTILESVLKYPKIPQNILSNIRDISLCLAQGSDKKLAAEYCNILAQLPLEIALTPNCDKQLYHKNQERIFILYQWHKSSPCFNSLRPKYFKTFLEALDPNSITTSAIYPSLVEKSSCNLQRDHFVEYLRTVQDNHQLLSYHLQYEAARYCVQQKLRTTLGKPQETFLAIEAVIMKYARFLAEKEGLPMTNKNLKNVMDIQENCRMLLGFLECLEKHIYNAAEGTAYAMLPAEKPAKTFFRVNASTCKEWFKRIRTAVSLISLHSMEPELVIRYSESILESEAVHTNLALLDRTVTSMVWALYNCGESDTLYGITAWLKSKHGKRFEWIQYVAEHASGHLEKAATGYLYTLHDENNKAMDSYKKEFLQKLLTDCFYHTARWSEIPNITQETIYPKQHLQTMEQVYQSKDYLQYTWKNPELTNSLLELTEWPEDSNNLEKPKFSPKLETYSYYEALRKLQDTCLVKSNSNDLKNGVYESMRKCVHEGIRNGLLRGYEPGFNNNQLDELIIINHISQKQNAKESVIISAEDNCLDTKMSSLLLSKTLYMCLITGQQDMKQQQELLLNLSSKARLENNLNYCQSLLTKFFKSKNITLPLNEISQQLKANQLNIDYNDKVLVQGIEELVKCLQAQTTSISDALELGSACCSEILKLNHSNDDIENSSYPCSVSNLLLTMADWLTIHRLNNTNLTNGQQFQKLQQQLPELTCCSLSDNTKSNVLPSSDYAVGKLLNASILCKQDSGAAWFSYGNWCYRWGKKLMETKGTEHSASMNEFKDIKLTKRNVSSIQELLKDKFDNNTIQQIINLLNSHILNAINDDTTEDLDANTCTENTTEMLEQELKNICALNTEQLNAILSIWRQAHKGVYGFYEEATKAYFKYLAIESDTTGRKSNAHDGDNNEVEDCTFVTTTLRLLRLIVKHAIGLQDVLEEGLHNTPLRPWKVIVLQLFSRLNHHEPYVRKSLAELLCRLAVDQPQLIIFPAVVGAQQELKYRNTADTKMQLTNCFSSLLNSLTEQEPGAVLQVQLLVKELRRITLLWDEYWIHSLSQLYAEYAPLYNTLDAEAKKTNNGELMQAKFEVFRQHLLADFKQIASATEKEPETNYEHSFQERFGTYIEAVLKELQKDSKESKPSEYWHKIKQLYGIFQQRPLRGNSSTLKISEISPVLANMHNTTIAMPGVDTHDQTPVYIKSVEATAFIFIPTKTKPKKLSFYGSNGQRYTYLFKGQEDLHLDERIMQFLSISNSMMARSYGCKAKTDCFKADHYSVIPLGSRSGLIRWVDNCSPLFAIYKKWQQRDALLKQQQKERLSSTKGGQENIEQSPTCNTNATRPSELFYNKLTPLLADCNLKVTDPRRQWPMPVLKRVLKELSAETPKDLLSKEIWCYSANAVEWRKSVRRYSLSLAVMSIIGYVIGLGDRHLDNVLIKLATGEILHIDYSVCFEKGKTLRVPEKVPFRMTQNIKDALGLVGTEGAFRLACTHVLKILRKERETLLTLLEAFVYDPLVDWTVSDDGTTTVSRRTTAHNAANIIANMDSSNTSQHLSPKSVYKSKRHEIDLSRQSMALRITEIKPTWIKYKNDFDTQLNDLDVQLEHIVDFRKNIAQLEQERDNFSKQLAMVRELEALGSAQTSHAFIQRYNVYKHDLDSYNNIKLMVQKTINELELLLSSYSNIVTNPEIMHNIELNPKTNDFMDHNDVEFDIIKDFLIDNNWNNVYVQAKFNRHEMENTFIQTQRSAIECRDLLVFYSRVMQFYPRSQLQNYRLMKYKQKFANLMKTEETTESAEKMKQSEGNEGKIIRYFESMKMIYLDLQKNIVHAKEISEEHKQQPVPESSFTLNSLNDFISLNPSHNTQLLSYCMLRHILQASQLFELHEKTLLQNGDNFLPNKQLSFLQLINTFVNAVYNTYNNSLPSMDIMQHVITALQSTCYLRECLVSLIGKIFNIFMMDDNTNLQKLFNEYEHNNGLNLLENYKPLQNVFGIIDEAVNNLELALKVLQAKILENTSYEPTEMSSWNIDISDHLQKLRCDLKITVVENVKNAVESLQTNDCYYVYDIRRIRFAIDDIIFAGIHSTFFNGLLSFTIKTVHQNITNQLAPLESLNEIDLPNADLLCGHLYVSLQHESVVLCDDYAVMQHSKVLEEYQHVMTAYFWLNEDHLKNTVDVEKLVSSKREFLNRLHEIYQVLVVWKSTILKIQTDLELHRRTFKDLLLSLTSSEDLIVKQQQFDNAINYANQRYNFFLNLTVTLSEYVAVILQFEMCSEEQTFENLLKLYADLHQEWLKSEASITAVERNLVQLLDPEDKIDQYWIENVSGLLDEMIYGVQKKISDMEKEKQLADGQKMQSLVDSTLRMDLRMLFKMLTKICKQSSKVDNDDLYQDVKDLQQSLKNLQTKLNELQTELYSQDSLDSLLVDQMQDKIQELRDLCNKNNEDVAGLFVRLLQSDTEQRSDSPTRTTSSQNDLANKEVVNSQMGEQKRNAYAVSVWKRIRMKLEGRDPDHNRRSSVAEQVDFVIREATNEENLASLYEGWTPWV